MGSITKMARALQDNTGKKESQDQTYKWWVYLFREDFRNWDVNETRKALIKLQLNTERKLQCDKTWADKNYISLRVRDSADREEVRQLAKKLELVTWSMMDPIEEGYYRMELFIPQFFPEDELEGNRFLQNMDTTLSKFHLK